MLKHFLSRQFAGFLLVGGLAAFLHWLARILLSLVMPYGWAVFLAYGVGMGIAFALNSRYIFPTSDKPVRKQARDFLAINLALLPLVWLASLMLNQWLIGQGAVRYSEEIAHASAITLPVMATFLLYKFFAFREKYYG
jgi:putative flippase GtrA